MLARKAVTAVEFILLAGMAVFIVVLMSTYTLKGVFSPTLNQSNQSLTGIEEQAACFNVNCADTCNGSDWRNHSAVCVAGKCVYRGQQYCATGCLNGACIETAPRVDFTLVQAGGGLCQWVSADASASNDPDGRIMQYNWRSKNGSGDVIYSKTSNSAFDFLFPAVYPATHNITLEVIDNSGKTNSTTKMITLVSPC